MVDDTGKGKLSAGGVEFGGRCEEFWMCGMEMNWKGRKGGRCENE